MADEGNKALANIKNLAGSVGTGLNEFEKDAKKGFNDAKAGVYAVKNKANVVAGQVYGS